MSDLISRSGLLKQFCMTKDGHRIQEKDCDNFEITVSIKDIKRIIREQPTAYDIDKVVDKLEKQRDIIFQNTDSEIRTVRANAWNKIDILNKAIEIVKQDDVSDDSCEWRKYLNHPYDWLVGCEHGLISSKQGDYCPYCGKKIKVVK